MGRIHRGQVSMLRHQSCYYVDGRNNYQCSPRTGPDVAGYTVNFTGYLIVVPWLPTRDFFLKEYGILVSSVSSSGAMVRLGVYGGKYAPYGAGPTFRARLLDEGEVGPVNSTGFYSRTLTNPKLLAKGSFYFGAFTKNSTGTFNVIAPAAILSHLTKWWGSFEYGATPGYLITGGTLIEHTYGALPTSVDISFMDAGFMPTMFWRERNQNE